jgi:hypothetical protein
MSQQSSNDSPASLVAIARAARLCGDRELERAAKRELRERFGIELSFSKKKPNEATT